MKRIEVVFRESRRAPAQARFRGQIPAELGAAPATYWRSPLVPSPAHERCT